MPIFIELQNPLYFIPKTRKKSERVRPDNASSYLIENEKGEN